VGGTGTLRAPELPVQLTRFVGRQAEVAAVLGLLEQGRLVTLTGAGGSGKTRLALEVAGGASVRQGGRVRWVELAVLSRAELLTQHVAAALGVREPGPRSWREAVMDELRSGELLLVLDNCEHLVDACAHLAEALLKGCPGLRILATSREALGVGGERAWLVPALSLPEEAREGQVGGTVGKGAGAEVEDIAATDAVRLFVERARAVLPSFDVTPENATAIARICRRLDGLPLAIELAAARIRVLAPVQIADRLDVSFRFLTAAGRGAIPRHRTLWETLDWSYALLADAERVLLLRLSVFAGTFSLDAVEAVCACEDIGVDDTLDVLTALVDKSLVAVEAEGGEARYRLLEAVREYASQGLEKTGEFEALRRRHADFFLALAEELAPETFGGSAPPGILARLDGETANLRAAGNYFEQDDAGPDDELRLYAALAWYWFARARLREGRRRITNALDGRGSASEHPRARALSSLAAFAFWQGDDGAVRAPAEESVRLLREVDDGPALSFALSTLGAALTLEGKAEPARQAAEEAVALARHTGDPRRISFSLYWGGRDAMLLRDLDAARTALEEAVDIGRRQGWAPAVAHAGTVLARVQYLQRDFPSALATSRDVFVALRELGSLWGLVQALRRLAAVLARVERATEAARLLGAVQALRQATGADFAEDERRELHEDLVALEGALGHAAFGDAFAQGLALDFAGALTLAEGEITTLAELNAGAEAAEAAAAGPVALGPGAAAPDAGAPAARSANAEEPTASSAPGVAGAVLFVSAAASGPPAALHVRALGPLEIDRLGERVPHDAWSYARPRELLVYLACHPEGRTRDQIGAEFWPDGSPGQLKNSFHVTLHHLRRTLGGADWVVLDGDRYRLAPERDVVLDAAHFERLLRAALPSPRNRGASGSVADTDPGERLEAALALYRGDFLAGEVASDWHLEPRDDWRRLYLDGLLALGDVHLGGGDPRAAADAYRRVVLRDDLHEDAYRRLMTALARSGERAEAARHYARLAETLADVLGSTPEPASTHLMERIRRAEPV